MEEQGEKSHVNDKDVYNNIKEKLIKLSKPRYIIFDFATDSGESGDKMVFIFW